ncbi:MAG TPA: hypothetical protein VFQ84_02720 [Arenimonas sp.]|uniref:hypothetical protein n=1 Tax=Arenimonas sp. TaxID=1872635 RepID=UPI002D809438|nr:hypothetical protein [Arenimonas sp.]HEU0152241.1 hypothetical protein [Arenimonas sp.]
MTPAASVREALAAARRRHAAIVAAFAVPVVAGLAFALSKDASLPYLLVLAVIAALVPLLAWLKRPGRDPRSLARRLDARADLEDSADLLFADEATLGPLQQMQRRRLEARLATRPADLRSAWPKVWLAAAWIVSAGLIAAIVWLPPLASTAPRPAGTPASGAAPVDVATDLVLARSELRIEPPAYTGLDASSQPELSGKVPQDARLQWRLRFTPQPAAVALVFHDGQRLPLRREGEDWTASRTLASSTLYRIVPAGPLPLREDPLYRLDVIPDQPPRIRAVAPERSLTLATPGQRRWDLDFEASDDHGLGAARLEITLAQGSGEQVTVKQQALALRGEGSATLRRYARSLDLASLGLAEGDDLIVRLVVADNRTPTPQQSRSASFILRWPLPPSTESTGMEGLVKKALPAYFRSQRQIIIDAEALLADRPQLSADEFMLRSNNLGVDQRLLRLRYGQFLGEESEGEPEPPPGYEDGEHSDDDGHDHGSEPPAAPGPPGGDSVLELYGHTHDEAEAATLLDPETRALLKQALDAMWLSEGGLRQGDPAAALPHAYRALGFIKQVQQASRIYLARVGLELPAIDAARRMTGDRKGIASRPTGLATRTPGESPALPLWQALAEPSGGGEALDAFAAWLAENEARVADPLSLLAAIDALRRDPGCAECRATLRARLWPLLPREAAMAPPRTTPDARGQAYLEALMTETPP